MRKFVSLGAAMMVGAVIGRENHVTTLSSARAVTTYARPGGHLEKPKKLHHPRHHELVGDVESERKSISSSPTDV